MLISKTTEAIIITIPFASILNGAENHPDSPCIITDKDVFINEMLSEMQEEDVNDGLNRIEAMLDNVYEEIVHKGNGGDCFKLKNEDED